jgi:hypothetical protein
MPFKKAPAKKPAPPVKEPTEVRIVCTCDRLPLPDGHVLVRGQYAAVPIADAKAYEAQERAKRG